MKESQLSFKSCQPTAEYNAFALFLILPYLTQYFRDPEAIAQFEESLGSSNICKKLATSAVG